jgi:uncharacterized beta-barrel protein YwiB (DUF1934 family)
MKKEVLITIEGLQLGTEEEAITVQAQGQYHLRNGKHFIYYDEMDDEAKTVTKCSLKISRNHIELTKKGVGTSRMMFDPSELTDAVYQTPFGSLYFDIQTMSLQIVEAEENIQIALVYSLFNKDIPISDHKLIVRINSIS